jgi:hypothetical protein
VAVTEAGEGRFSQVNIDDPPAHFKGKTISVTGSVTVKDKRPQIEVDDPEQIQIMPFM